MLTSLPVVIVVALAAGAMITVQAAASLSLIGGGPFAGTLVGLSGVREIFPLLAAASVAARSGAEFASTLGAMKVGEQIAAIEVMGLDPLRLLVAPRIFAASLGTAAAVTVANVTGLLGSFFIGTVQLGIDPGAMWHHLMMSVDTLDLVVGIGKGLVLGWLIAVVATREGLVSDRGARGVGQATNRAVVRSMVVVCLTGLLITYSIYGQATVQ